MIFYHDNKDDNRIHIPENELQYENNSLQQPAIFMANTKMLDPNFVYDLGSNGFNNLRYIFKIYVTFSAKTGHVRTW